MSRRAAPATMVAALLLLSLVAVPTMANAQSTVALTVNTQYADGASLTGMWTVLRSGGPTGPVVSTGFSPVTFNVTPGEQYTVSVGNYQDIVFNHWEDTGSTTSQRQVAVTEAATVIALYTSDAHPLPPEEEEDPPEPEGEDPVTVMDNRVITNSYGVYSSKPARAEHVTSTSALAGTTIDSITVGLRAVGTITGNAQIGVFDASGSVKKLFGTVDVSTVPVAPHPEITEYTFAIADTYIIAAGDRIGVSYTGGNSSAYLAVALDFDLPAFDGQNSYHQYFMNGAWNNAPNNQDMYMVLQNTKAGGPPPTEFTPVTHMEDRTASYGVLVSGAAYSGNHQIAAELVKSTSVLVGKPIDEITMMVQRVGTPTGNAEVAVFDASRNVKKLFGMVDVSTIPTAMTEMTFTIPDLYTMAADDRIGLRFTGGSTSAGVSVMMDKVTSDSIFDGQNAQRARGTSTGWLTYDVNEDLWMTLRQTKPSGEVGNQPPVVQPVVAAVPENSASGVAIALLGSDPEAQPLTFYPVTQPAKGTLSIADDNIITYTSYDWHDGQDSFQYAAHDGEQASEPATVSITIQNTGSKTTSRIVVVTEFEDGRSTTGKFVSLAQGGTTINSGFSHVHFDVNNGQTYTVTVNSSNFLRWEDTGSTNPARSINISQDRAIVAVYSRP